MKDRTTLARWTPRRLLSLLMALIMTLSLLPTAALAATISGPYTLDVADAPTDLIVGQESADIKAELTADATVTSSVNVRLKVTVERTSTSGSIGAADCTLQYKDPTIGYTAVTLTPDTTGTISGYLNGTAFSLSHGIPVSADFKLSFNAAGSYGVKVEAVSVDATGAVTASHVSETKNITVKDAIKSLAVDPANPEEGKPFTVTAMTNVDNGKILFKYGTQFETVNVLSMGDGTGYARHNFIAEATASGSGANAISAKIFDVLGVPPAMETATLTVATPVANHTVVFRANGDNVYTLPAPQPVKHGEKATEPAIKPERKGYTFGGWYKDAACTNTAKYDFTTDTVTGNLELYAKWTAKQVTVIANTPTVASAVEVFFLPTTPLTTTVTPHIGANVTFYVTVPAEYDPSTILAYAGYDYTNYKDLAPVAQSELRDSTTGNVTAVKFQYQFELTENLVDPTTNNVYVGVYDTVASKTFTVMMPTGHFNAEITAATPASSTVAAGGKSASIVYDGSYTFTVTPDTGYDVAVYVNGAKKDAEANGSYRVTDVTGPQSVAVVESAIPNYNVTFTVPLSGEFFTQSVARGKTATKPGVNPAREGYTFEGWYAADEYPNGAQFNFTTETITKDTVLFGKLTPKIYKIQYNLNGAAGTAPADQLKTHGLAEKLSTEVPTREGFTFLGWGTTADATAPSYQPGDMYSVDKDITLYAVWQQKTYTITFSSGEGYTLHSGGSMTVEHGGSFDFNLIVDPAYAEKAPSVWTNTAGVSAGTKIHPDPSVVTKPDGAKVYYYKLMDITADTAVNALVTANTTYTVTFMTNGTIYQTQQVEFNHKATQPVDPKVEGYTFGGWYKDPGCADADKWNFATPITSDTMLYAKLDPIYPEITWKTPTATDGYTIEVKGTKAGTATTLTSPGTVDYGSTVTFTITISTGYDASKMQVGINNQLLAPKEINGDTYTFEFTAKQDTKITVVGVARKTVTIIYNDNGGYGGPVQETVNYFLPSDVHNGKISETVPTREGYDFKGWSTDNKATWDATADEITHESGVTATDLKPGAESPFISDTVLYAVWHAKETGIDLKVDKTEQYEGEDVTLTATITSAGNASVTTGSVQFYRSTDGGANWKLLESAVVSGGTAIHAAKTSDFVYGGTNTDTYKAVFIPTEGNGYTKIETATNPTVTVKSTAISWEQDTTDPATHKIKDKANVLTIKDKTGTTVDSMVAGQVYTLELPAIYALDEQNTKLTVNKDYSVTWQYRNDKGVWTDYTNSAGGDTTTVDAAYSQYVFRAVVTPVTGATSHFTKAAKYDTSALVKDQYETVLISKPTTEVTLQATTTALEITGADNEENDVYINGTQPFNATGSHLAQFEGQKVTLTATVTDTTTNVGVKSGEVKFFRYVDGTNDELLNTTLISVDSNGVATYEVEISNWDTTQTAANNKDEFYAVYQPNATYDTSASWTTAAGELKAVYIKSTAIKTPIIESKLEGEGSKKATTYNDNLTGLLAGVQHEFKLRTGNAEPDWSVVALDGRTVDAGNYDIKWLKTTGSNEQEVDATGTNQIKVDENKVGDRYRVKLTGKGVFAGSEATSQDAVIGTKQDVTVTVEASDEIKSTPETDVYQLNEITLTATVAAAGTSPTMKPAGSVTFYYKDGDSWVKLDSAALAEDTNHNMTASITTKKLPVTDTTNTWRNVEITAVYEGNDTFNVSRNYDATNSTVSAGTTENGVKDDTVTVYSSVVFNCNDENKKQTTDGDKGIHISVSDGAFKANEKATLALSDIYTLDRNLDMALLNTIAKLNPTTDYTIQWQKLNGATAITGSDYSGSANWQPIDNATGTTLVLDKVEQNTAYRAVITVKDQPITKGSFDELDQGVIDTADANDGRQVYYSNVLMPTDTNMTVSVALNTSKIGAENTEGITEGETVTANVFLSGVVGAVPNANVTVKVTNDSAKGNDTAYEKTFTSMNTVNGWNAFSWNTAESDDNGVPTAPGFYTLTVSATTNTGYAAKEITRSLIVRESSYDFEVGNTNPTYNGRTQGLTVELKNFSFNGNNIVAAANKSWTVKYYVQNVEGLATGALVEPTQAGTYKAVITLPASAYWTEQTKTVDFIIEKRSVSIADAIAQAKVYDGTTDVNIVEVMLNDAETDQTTTGLPTNNVGIINGDSIYAVATAAALNSANAGNNSFTISTIELRGDDANNYVWNGAPYTEDIYVSRSQVYGVSSTDVTLKAGEKLPADAVYMIDQAGNKITTYDVLYYLHTDTEIKKVDNTNEKGLYTVIVRPKQDNYKSGVTLKVTVGDTTSYTPAVAPKPSTLIYLSDTATKYNPAGNAPVTAKNAQGNAVKVEYQTGTTWSETVPSNAGRYLVKATDTNTGDVAYGIYTITKAHPSIDFNAATGLTYNSMPQNGYSGTPTVPTSAESYFTYAGDVAIGYNTPADGNVDEQAPVDAGTYTVTLHVNETANYTAHEISKSFTIAKKALTIKADSWQTTQYDAFPDMTAGYTGLAAETGDTTPDTSLRDVQIAPEFLYNPTGGKSNYSNDSLDQVGGVAIQPIDALSKNYAITYENGQYTKQRTETNVDFAIHGLPQSGDRTVNRVYYGDEIQLYPYGYYTTHANGSGILEWSVTTATGFKGMVTIGKETGLLNVNGVGEFTVTLKRGVGEQQISTSVTVTAIQKEAKIALKNVDKVYTGASQTYAYEGNVTVHDELYQALPYFDASKVTRTNTTRTDVGTQITTAKVTGALAYQSETYGGKFTINDKEATVAPVAQSTVYGTLETFDTTPTYKVDGRAGSVDPVTGVNVASQTDAYNRLDVHDGYEILVAGAENMNYNVKYTTDETAEDSAVTTYDGMKLYSTTTKAKNKLNDATVYGEQANDLDWILYAVKSTTRDSVDYADNLADFDLTDTTGIFIKQDKDDCVGNAKTYKAANREEGNTSITALAADRTATDTAKDDNYELKFGSVTNAKAANYTLANAEVKNAEGTMTAPTGTVGFIGAAATSDNLIEGSANIAQRPIKLEKAVTDAQLYWRLPQSQLYTALVNILKAEENSVGRGLAKGHTIEDLDLSFTIGSTPVDKNNDQPMTGLTVGTQTVTVTVGDTNYKLEGGQYQFDIVLKNIQIEATYTTKTFTGFTVLIKVHNEGGAITPLNDAKGLSYKIFKKTAGGIDKSTAYAEGTLTYQNRTAYDDKGVICGVFTATYPQLPLLNSGETYFIQMYEYGVELKTNS